MCAREVSIEMSLGSSEAASGASRVSGCSSGGLLAAGGATTTKALTASRPNVCGARLLQGADVLPALQPALPHPGRAMVMVEARADGRKLISGPIGGPSLGIKNSPLRLCAMYKEESLGL
jgi:hypothetical protein